MNLLTIVKHFWIVVRKEAFEEGVPVVVAVVKHQKRGRADVEAQHLGLIQKRNDAKIRANGGRKFASWAQLMIDGKATGPLERFETYDTEVEARAHAKYAAGKGKAKQ